MIRIFGNTDRDFSTNGDAVLVPIKAKAIHNLNGDFYLDITCKSEFYPYLTQGNIIVAPTPQGDQAFRIGNKLDRKGDKIELKAYHVLWDAQNYVIADSYVVDMNCKAALNHLNAATDTPSPFTMDSDVTGVYNLRCVRKSLYEAIQDVIARWGGNLLVDNWKVNVKAKIGKDNGITIRYAKNLIDLTASYDFTGVCTKLLPVGKDGLLLPELYVYSQTQYDIPYTKVLSISQSLAVEDFPTKEDYQAALVADLRRQAQETVNKSCVPVVTYTLQGRPELVQDVGDIIQVIDERIGVNITTQVIGYEYDIVTGQYSKLTFGNFGNSLSGLMTSVKATASGVVNEAIGEAKSEVNADINGIYNLLQGSYVIYRGYDVLICDKKPVENADNIIKFSNTGISITTEGINGDFVSVYDINTQALSVKSLTLNGTNINEAIENLENQIKELEKKVTIHKPISYANYNQLPATKLSDGVFYYIADRGYLIQNGIIYGQGDGTISYGLANPTGGGDSDVYFQLDEYGYVTKIWQNHKGNWSGLGAGALQFWTETLTQLYNTREIEGMSAGVDGYLFNYATWYRNEGQSYYRAFQFRKKYTSPAIFGAGGYTSARHFYLLSTDPNAVLWEYRCTYISQEWQTPANTGAGGGDASRTVELFSIEYNGTTWYGSHGTTATGDQSGSFTSYPTFNSINNWWYGKDSATVAKDLLEQCYAKPTTTYKIGIGTTDKVLYFGHDDEYRLYVTDEGVFNGKDFQIDGVSIDRLHDVQLENVSVVTDKVAHIGVGENLAAVNGVLHCTLPFAVVNGELCFVYDDGE